MRHQILKLAQPRVGVLTDRDLELVAPR
jgi:hypothetical protein